jgi:hypothetical protein
MKPIRSECSDQLEPGCDAWMPGRPDMEWTIAEDAAWAAILSAHAGNRASSAASSKEV